MPGMDTGSTKDGVGQVFDAVDAFDQYLNPEEDDQDGEGANEDEGQDADKDQHEGSESETEEEEASEEEAETESELEDEEEQGDESQARKFTVRVDGKDETVSESELIAGYQRQSDYTRKTQALANDRKSFETERVGVNQERTEYAQLLPKLRQALANGMGKEPDWEALRQEDPAKAAVEKQRWDERKARIAQVEAEEARLVQQQAEENRVLAEKIIKEQGEKALVLMPHWKDEAKKKSDNEGIKSMLLGLGFAEDETTIYDARALHIAYLASKYLEIQKQKPALKKKIIAAPVAKPGSSTKPKLQTEVQKAHKRLAKTGSMKDAAKAFEAFV